mgnify:FL=1
MKTTVTFTEFDLWFLTNRTESFSRAGRSELFNYLVELEEDTGIEIEFDPIAISCEFSEYENLEEFHLNYDKEKYPTIDELYDHTQVIPIGTEGFIIQDF